MIKDVQTEAIARTMPPENKWIGVYACLCTKLFTSSSPDCSPALDRLTERPHEVAERPHQVATIIEAHHGYSERRRGEGFQERVRSPVSIGLNVKGTAKSELQKQTTEIEMKLDEWKKKSAVDQP